MKDLKKLWRMQGSYFVIAFCLIEAVELLWIRYFSLGRKDVAWSENMVMDEFIWLHILLCCLLATSLFVRYLFAAGKKNQEFLRMLPVRKGSWQLFTTLAGMVLLTCVYAMTFAYYYALCRGKIAGGSAAVGLLFVKGYLLSVVEYHVLILAGVFCQTCFTWIQETYYKKLEGGDEE